MLKIAWSPLYCHPLPEGHRFPMLKYELIPEQLLYEGTIKSENLFTPEIAPTNWITNAHEAFYWERLQNLQLSASEIRAMGFPLSAELIEREWQIASGTIQNAVFALQHGVSMNIAGGTHHAFSSKGEGFCLLNDQAIAAHYLLATQKASKILIVDLDVHQGNGTASIFQNNANVFTFSMHGANNYPARKEISDLDIGLPDYCNDQYYLSLIRSKLPELIGTVEPDFVFYQAGVDILESDKLGKLSVSRQGCKERDKIVLEECFRNKLPLVITMGGGYSEKITDIVEAHCNTFRLAQEIWY
jgi:acetoin utilization deacetylase AcuC-like enzyme